MSKQQISTQVLIIGGGVTGTGLARDLALRGVQCVLLERKDINAGASGSNHGLLHSGARYVSNDPLSARQCGNENRLLKKLAGDFIEETGGLFVALEGDDEKYIEAFPGYCQTAGIACRSLSIDQARKLEPGLSPSAIAAFEVEDATIDPFGLSLANIADAKKHQAIILLNTEVTKMESSRGRIQTVEAVNRSKGETIRIIPEIVINAAGVWSGKVASLAGVQVKMIYSKGTLMITNHRLTHSVINRLRPPADGDIVVPGGTVSILGTTSSRIDSLTGYRPTEKEIDYIVDEIRSLLPQLDHTRCIRAYSGIRPLIMQENSENDRSASREFELFDHEEDGLNNFITITGGKLTTYRYMAEKTADLACRKIDVTVPCQTDKLILKPAEGTNWTYPGLSPKIWLRNPDQDDLLLCECEMVSKKVIDGILNESEVEKSDLKSIGLRSRLGKGSCQGAFCSIRLMAHLYDRQLFHDQQGVESLRKFIQDRWVGQKPVLWAEQMAQAELSEAVHCGLFCLEA